MLPQGNRREYMEGRIIQDHTQDPYLGLAIDHSLLLHSSDNRVTLRLWSNPPSVVIGRGQSLGLEVNQNYCLENSIKICRRISGGGAVYQDEGNLNISLIFPRKSLAKLQNLQEATRLLPYLLLQSLEHSGISHLSIDEMNSIYLDGLKVSGAASYLSRDTVLSHSTLLLSANLEKLEKSLLHPEGARRKSRYSPTGNMSVLDVEAWKPTLIDLLGKRFSTRIVEDNLTTEEAQLAERLCNSVYAREDWIIEGRITYDVILALKKGIV
jgi:lipoate-protein ligase A